MPQISIDPLRCIQCYSCVHECPARVFTIPSDGADPLVSTPDRCIACGHCVAICPVEAVRHSAYPLESVPPLVYSSLPGAETTLNLLRWRRSMRVFTGDPLEPESIDKILEAAALAPNASNLVTTRLVIVQDPHVLVQVTELTVFYMASLGILLRNRLMRGVARIFARELVDRGMRYLPQLDEMVQKVKEGADPILHHATCLLVFYAKKGVVFSSENANLALQNATLMCQALRLGSFYTGFVVQAARRDRALRELLKIPKDNRMLGGMAIGHPRNTYPRYISRQPLPLERI
jgi:nitroreductase/NAD-dependent dihydropyrimidine dehydrogenase PreA subunit